MNENNNIEAEISWIIIVPHVILMFFFIGFITIWKPLIAKFTTKLSHNGKIITGKVGLIKTISIDSPLSKITSVKVIQGLFGKIFDYGTIVINTSGDHADYVFDYIKNPYAFKNSIKEYIEQ